MGCAAHERRGVKGKIVKPGDLVEVIWADAWDDSDYDSSAVESLREEYPVRTIGEVVEDGERVLRLANHFRPDGQVDITSIPQSLVKIIRFLDRRGPNAILGIEARLSQISPEPSGSIQSVGNEARTRIRGQPC